MDERFIDPVENPVATPGKGARQPLRADPYPATALNQLSPSPG